VGEERGALRVRRGGGGTLRAVPALGRRVELRRPFFDDELRLLDVRSGRRTVVPVGCDEPLPTTTADGVLARSFSVTAGGAHAWTCTRSSLGHGYSEVHVVAGGRASTLDTDRTEALDRADPIDPASLAVAGGRTRADAVRVYWLRASGARSAAAGPSTRR